MDTEKKEVVEKVIHEDGANKYASKSTANTGLGFGIAVLFLEQLRCGDVDVV